MAVEAAKVHIRKDKWTVLLYLIDLVKIAFASASYAVVSVPLLWFWVAMYDLGSIQQVLAKPIDREATWQMAVTYFLIFFTLHLTFALATGKAGESARRRAAKLADQLFVALHIRSTLPANDGVTRPETKVAESAAEE